MAKLNSDRFLALDVGDRRIGVAAGSREAGLARPVETWDRKAMDEAQIVRRLRELIKEEKAATVVVGDPLNMDGSVGPRSEISREFAAWVKRVARQVEVVMADERLSSFSADEAMERDGVKASKKKGLRDAYAASAILQEYFASTER